MSQSFYFEDLTIAENIRLFGGIYGMKDSDIKRKTDELSNNWISEHKNDIVAASHSRLETETCVLGKYIPWTRKVFLDEPTAGGVWTLLTRGQFLGTDLCGFSRSRHHQMSCHHPLYGWGLNIVTASQSWSTADKAMGSPAELKRTYGKPNGWCVHPIRASGYTLRRLKLKMKFNEAIYIICHQGI